MEPHLRRLKRTQGTCASQQEVQCTNICKPSQSKFKRQPKTANVAPRTLIPHYASNLLHKMPRTRQRSTQVIHEIQPLTKRARLTDRTDRFKRTSLPQFHPLGKTRHHRNRRNRHLNRKEKVCQHLPVIGQRRSMRWRTVIRKESPSCDLS